MKTQCETLGSLFDGSGGFPLGGVINGIRPVWASEIEPYPLRVTAARFPHMKQLGDVTKINGKEIEPVDIITFGSPCQDLSVAGKQAGIHDGERSSLFFEAVRIIKEMRDVSANKYPRFAVWENVPGAFSSNGGEDFRSVLEELGGVCEDGLSIPRPKKWNHAGCVVGNGWSIAWRTYDAQYWGVPQRRKRIYLIADFAGERAGEILFEREGVRGDTETGGEAREGATADAERGAGGSGGVGLTNSKLQPAAFMGGQGAKARSIAYCDDGSTPTLKPAPSGGNTIPDVVYPINTMVGTRGGKDDMRTGFGIGEPGEPQFTISAAHEHGVCYALQGNGIDRADTAGCNGAGWREGEMYTLNTIDRPAVCYGIDQQGGKGMAGYGENVSPALCSDSHGTPHAVCYPDKARALCARADSSPCVDRGQNVICYASTANYCGSFAEAEIGATLQTRYHYGSGGDAAIACYDARGNGDGKTAPTLTGDHQNRVTDYTAIMFSQQRFGQYTEDTISSTKAARDYKSATGLVVEARNLRRKYIVRRLTPLECCRLQGFPDWWENGVEGSDSARYKMWGNGVSLPTVVDVIGRIAKELRK